MARPIPFDAPIRDAKLELIHRLNQAPADHAAALLDAYELLQVLHDNKVIDTMRGLVGSGETVLDIAVDGALEPTAVRAMRNLILLFKIVGSIEPDTLKKFAEPIPQAMQVTAVRQQPPSLWSMMKSVLGDRNIRQGMAAMLKILGAIGMGLNGEAPSQGTHGEHTDK